MFHEAPLNIVSVFKHLLHYISAYYLYFCEYVALFTSVKYFYILVLTSFI